MAFVLGADGLVEATDATLPSDGCCLPSLCMNCDLICSFINILPEGPLWDFWKRKALDWVKANQAQNGSNSAMPYCPVDLDCPSLVLYAIYAAYKLLYYIQNLLWQVLREWSPYTAETTLSQWLDRYQWQDCFKQYCRGHATGELSPYEVMTDCGPQFCPPNCDPALEAAVNRGLVLALTRVSMGGIKTMAWINWVLEPLGAKLQPKVILAPIPCGCAAPCLPKCDMEFEVVCTGDTIPGVTSTPDPCVPVPRPQIQAFCEYTACDANGNYLGTPAGLPLKIYPGVIAADCLIRSLLFTGCSYDFKISIGCCP